MWQRMKSDHVAKHPKSGLLRKVVAYVHLATCAAMVKCRLQHSDAPVFSSLNHHPAF